MKMKPLVPLILLSIFVAAECYATSKSETITVNGLDIAKQMQDFYDSAWTKLIWMIGSLGVIVGLIIPYFASRQQLNVLKLQKQEMEKMISDAKQDISEKSRLEMIEIIKNAKPEIISESKHDVMQIVTPIFESTIKQGKEDIVSLTKDLELKMNESFISELDKIKEKMNASQGHTFMVQGNQTYESKEWYKSYNAYLLAANFYIAGQEDYALPYCFNRAVELQETLLKNNVNISEVKMVDVILGEITNKKSTDFAKTFIPLLKTMQSNTTKKPT